MSQHGNARVWKGQEYELIAAFFCLLFHFYVLFLTLLLWELVEIVLYNDVKMCKTESGKSRILCYKPVFFLGSGSKITARFPP